VQVVVQTTISEALATVLDVPRVSNTAGICAAGIPVMFVATNVEGVPRFGVVSTGEVIV